MGGSSTSGKGSTTGTSTPDPQVKQSLEAILSRANKLSRTPYDPYGGQLVAGLNPDQQAAFDQMKSAFGSQQPYMDQAQYYAQLGASPLQQSAINSYLNPYQNQVVQATMNELQSTEQANNAAQMGAGLGAGGLFNDRLGVQMGQLANQQGLANAQTLGGLNTQNWTQAVANAQADRAAAAQGAYTFGNLGQENLNAILTGAGATLAAGNQQQQQQQNLLNSAYNQWQIGKAYPYQQLSWLAGIDTGVGSNMGGTSTTTPPAANQWGPYIGAGMIGASMFAPTSSANTGGRIPTFADGGAADEGTTIRGPRGLNEGFQDFMNSRGLPGSIDLSDLEAHPVGVAALGRAAFGSTPNDRVRRGFDMISQRTVPHGYAEGGAPGMDPDAGAPSTPYAGVKSYIPTANITRGQGPPKPPSLPGGDGKSQPGQGGPLGLGSIGDMKGAGAGLGSLGSSAISGFGEAFPEAGAALADALPLLMLKTGGIAKGYADGGAPELGDQFDWGDTDTGAFDPKPGVGGADLSGFKPTPSNVEMRGVGAPLGDIGPGTDFPFNPTRTSGLPAYEEPIRGDVPLPQRRGMASPAFKPGEGAYEGPDEEEPPTGSVRPPRGIPEPIASGTRLADRGSETTGAGGSDAWRNALMAAGFGLMANRSPYLGQAIGNAGLEGMQAYQGTKKTEEGQRQQRVKEELSRETKEAQLKKLDFEMKRADRQLRETVRHNEATESRPQVIGEDQYGNKTYGVRDPNTGRFTDPSTGKVITATAPGSSDRAPIPAASMQVAEGFDKEVAALPPELRGPDTPRDEGALEAIPADMRDTVKGLVDYKINPASLSIKGGHRERLINAAANYDPTYDQSLFPAKQRAMIEFYSGGPQSPAGVMTAGNTAILHLGEMSDAMEELKAQPGPFGGIFKSLGGAGIPYISLWANARNNEALRGTPAGAALTKFETARQRFTAEVEKFYAGGQGTQAEREHSLALIDPRLSLAELRSGIAQDARLMSDKVAQMRNRLIQGMGPAAWRSAVVRDPDNVLVYKNSREALRRVQQREARDGAEAPEGSVGAAAGAGKSTGVNAPTVRYKGRLYDRQPDGTYLPQPGAP